MYKCEICGEKADIHHIVYRSEGGFDVEINYLYLCPLHHRGKNGPHQNKVVDLQYKLDLQKKLYNCYQKNITGLKKYLKFLVFITTLKRLQEILKDIRKDLKKKILFLD